jgi:hypothetical protein
MKITTIILTMFCLCLGMPISGDAGMSSDNYRITTTVVSGGGGPMASASYGLNGTLGQPSPLIDPADPLGSTNYEMLTGFWYTLGGGCRWDIEPLGGDGDVDGADLYEYLNAYDPTTLPAFAAEFGRNDCF